MNYLIFGINGMAGHMIAQYMIDRGHTVVGYARQPSSLNCRTLIGDATDQVLVKQAIYSEKYQAVINCMGVLNQSVDADIINGIYVNSLFPHLLAGYLKDIDIKLIHISTDCVFSGERGGYTEDDKPDENSSYGRSKALGEVVDKKNLTFRTSIIGPEIRSSGIGLFHWFMNQREEVFGYKRVMWSGVTTLQLAKAVEWASEQKITGIYHLTNNISISKFELLKIFNDLCRKDKIFIREDEHMVSDKSFLNTRKDFIYQVPPYEEMMDELSQWIRAHPALYHQYDIQE